MSDEQERKRIDVMQAVDIAKTYLMSLMAGEPQDVLLEEVELVSSDFWQVTLSFVRPNAPFESVGPGGDIATFLGGYSGKPRHYKVFLIDGTGEVRSMKMRAK